jgi:chromosome segregation ATPase
MRNDTSIRDVKLEMNKKIKKLKRGKICTIALFFFLISMIATAGLFFLTKRTINEMNESLKRKIESQKDEFDLKYKNLHIFYKNQSDYLNTEIIRIEFLLSKNTKLIEALENSSQNHTQVQENQENKTPAKESNPELTNLKKELSNLKIELTQTQDLLSKLHHNTTQTTTAIQELQTQNQTSTKLQHKLSTNLQNLENSLSSLKTSYTASSTKTNRTLQTMNSSFTTQLTQLGNLIHTNNYTITNTNNILSMLQNAISALQNTQNTYQNNINQALQSVTNELSLIRNKTEEGMMALNTNLTYVQKQIAEILRGYLGKQDGMLCVFCFLLDFGFLFFIFLTFLWF